MRPLARGPGLYEVAYQAYPLGVPQSFFHAKFDLFTTSANSRREPTTSGFSGRPVISLSMGHPTSSSAAIWSPPVSRSLSGPRPEGGDGAVETRSRGHAGARQQAGVGSVEAVPTGTLTNRRKQPLYVLKQAFSGRAGPCHVHAPAEGKTLVEYVASGRGVQSTMGLTWRRLAVGRDRRTGEMGLLPGQPRGFRPGHSARLVSAVGRHLRLSGHVRYWTLRSRTRERTTSSKASPC